MKDEESLVGPAVKAYDESLAEYHGWLVSKGAKLGMKLMPTKGELTGRVSSAGLPGGYLLTFLTASTETADTVGGRVKFCLTSPNAMKS